MPTRKKERPEATDYLRMNPIISIQNARGNANHKSKNQELKKFHKSSDARCESLSTKA